jgi:hypothetical protein
VRGSWRQLAGQGTGSLVAAALAGCLAIDELQTPNGDIDLSRDMPAEGAGDAGAPPESSGACGDRGWAFVRVGGRDQLPSWSAPDLAPSCGSAPHRLTALAPRMGTSLRLSVSTSTGRVVDATYSTTSIGADGETWGEYEALIDIEAVSFAAASSATEQPFEFSGTILGPFGPVSIAVSGCARVRPARC